MVKLRLAHKGELSLAFSFIEEAREHQREQGFVQWDENYPSLKIIEEDLLAGRGYMILDADLPIGYVCIDVSGDPSYETVDGVWRTRGGFIALHRLAVGAAGRGRGASHAVFDFAKALCRERGAAALRMDTDSKNQKMQHILSREGFSEIGTVYPLGEPKILYEWVVD